MIPIGQFMGWYRRSFRGIHSQRAECSMTSPQNAPSGVLDAIERRASEEVQKDAGHGL